MEEAASHLATSNAAFLRELLTHVRDKEGDVGAALARVAGAIGTDAAVDAMLARRDLRPIESVLGRMIHDLAETKTPVGQSSAYYYVSPRDATELKRRLAALLVAGGPNGAVASRLLASLRAKRVQDGQPPYEPWHPDIEQLRPSGQRRPLLT